MSKIITIANQKGGVSKTTTSGAFAAGLKKRGYNVLAIDLDAQGNLSDSVGADNETKPTIYDVFKGESSASESIQRLNVFDIIPANTTLASVDLEFTMIGKEYMLKEILTPLLENYDYIIIDTPPSLGIATVNAFTCSDEVIIPTTAGIFAATGITQLYSNIEMVKKYCNPKLKIAGILLTKYNPRSTINKEIRELTEELGEHINAKVYETYISSSVMVEESQANKMDIFSYSPTNTVSINYSDFIDEYLKGEK